MNELEILGRAIQRRTPEAPPAVERQGDFKALYQKQTLTLLEASSIANITVHTLKQAILDGKLKARWEGKYIIERCELDHFMRD